MGYRRDDQGLAFSNRNDEVVVRIPADGTLALLVDTACSKGPDGGAMVLKHGEDERVTADFRKMWSTLQHAATSVRSAQTSDMARALMALNNTAAPGDVMQDLVNDLDLVRIPVGQASDAVIAEVNACLDTSGRVAHLRDRLAGMGVDQSPGMPDRPSKRSLSPVP